MLSDEKWKEMLEKGQHFILRISNEDKIAIVFHDDCDGCCSAAIFKILFGQTYEKCQVELFTPKMHNVLITEEIINQLVEYDPDYILCIDLPIDKDPESIYKTLKYTKAKLFNYDHHVPTSLFQHPDFTQINPLIFDDGMKITPPTSSFAYRLFKYCGGRKDLCWLAGTGIVGDFAVEACKKEIEEVRHHYVDLYPFHEISQKMAKRSRLMTLAKLINSGYEHANAEGALLAVKTMIESVYNEGPYCLLEGKTNSARILHLFRRDIENEIIQHISDFKKRAQINEDVGVAFYMVRPRNYIVSELATRLCSSYPNLVLFVFSRNEEIISFSVRKGISVSTNLDHLVKTSIRNLEYAIGGGHFFAAGGSFPKEEFENFKLNVMDYLDRN